MIIMPRRSMSSSEIEMKSVDFTIDRKKKKYAAHCGHCGQDFVNAKDVLDHILALDAVKKEEVLDQEWIEHDPFLCHCECRRCIGGD